jgi:hypothetical protein
VTGKYSKRESTRGVDASKFASWPGQIIAVGGAVVRVEHSKILLVVLVLSLAANVNSALVNNVESGTKP